MQFYIFPGFSVILLEKWILWYPKIVKNVKKFDAHVTEAR